MDLQGLREARSKGVVAYTRFCLDIRRHTENLYCFFEGEDGKYYNERILTYTNYKYDEIISYQCGGRNEVIKVYHLICKEKKFSNIAKAFFIDRDFIPVETSDKPEIYQTSAYSIENYYSSVEVFKRVLNREFHLNVAEIDFLRSVDNFITVQKCFHDHMTLFNAWVYYQREKEREEGHVVLDISDFKIGKLFSSICINDVVVRCPIDTELIVGMFPNAYELDEVRLSSICSMLNQQDKQKFFRGKFELQFFKNVIEDLKKKNRELSYFTSHIDGVRVDVSTNPLSSLCQYAETPECLVEFLSRYKKAS